MALPKMARVRQHFDAPVLTDLHAAIHAELDRIETEAIINPRRHRGNNCRQPRV